MTKKKFINLVKKAKKYISIGDIFQVVLSQRFEKKINKEPLEIYKKIRKTNPSPFLYFFNFDEFQIKLSKELKNLEVNYYFANPVY